MYAFLLVAAAALASGFSAWLIERGRTPDRAFRISIGAGLASVCILGLAFLGERIAPEEWRNTGLAVGIITGALAAVALTGAFDLRRGPRRAN